MKKKLRPTQMIQWTKKSFRGQRIFYISKNARQDRQHNQTPTTNINNIQKTRCLFREKLNNKVKIASDKT